MMTLATAIPDVMGHRKVIKLFDDMNGVVIVGTHPINAMEVGSAAS
jgi:azurin